MPRPGPSTVDQSEVEQFSRLAPPWWDERGPLAMLHKFKPRRTQHVRWAPRRHAAQTDLMVDYRAMTAEALADKGERFDVVLALEVVEHVTDVGLFVRRCGEMVKPN